MNIERSILITFLGNYLVNTVVAAVVALIPASATPGLLTPQYITYTLVAAVAIAIYTWWYMQAAPRGLQSGIIFGVIGFVVALVVAFISGVAGVLAQTGSLSQMMTVIPNFGPFIWNTSTIVLFGYWVIPAALVGWWLGSGSTRAPMM
jgi:hypothetical protein